MVDNNVNMPFVPASFFNPVTGELKVDQKQAEAVQAGIQARVDTLPEVEKKNFLALSANLAPGDVDTPEKLDAVLNTYENAARAAASSTSPLAVFTGDVAKFLARALIQFAGEQRQNAMNDRLAARETARAELLSQANEMQKAADKMMAGATTAIVTAAIGGALSIGGSLASGLGTLSQLGKMGTQAKATDQATKQLAAANEQVSNLSKMSKGVSSPKDVATVNTALDAAKSVQSTATAAQTSASNLFNLANTRAGMIGAFGQAGSATGDTLSRTGSGADNRMQAEAKAMDAQGARDAANSQYAQQQADLKKEMQDTMNDMIKQVINFIKELKEAEVDAMRALTKV